MSPHAVCYSVLCVLVLIIAILGHGHPSAHAGHSPILAQGSPYLLFSTYLGGSTPCESCDNATTFAQNTACDSWGNIYVTGATTVSDLPVKNAFQPQPLPGSRMSAFVAKYDPAGKVLWCTYLGGNQKSMGIGVAAMPDGGVAVAGLTSSDASRPFPTMNAFQPQNNGQSDYFVTIFDASGNLRYSTYLGGSGLEGGPGTDVFVDDGSNGNNIAADSRGLVYVTGVTPSGGGPVGIFKFPVTSNAIQTELKGGSDAFLTIIDPSKNGESSLIYSASSAATTGNKGTASQ